MRLGLIGLGRIGAFHAETLSQLTGVDSLVVTDAVPAVTVVRRRDGSAPRRRTSPESADHGGVDGIVIAAATDAHTALIRAGVDAGIPVFCEKPLSGTWSEAVAIAGYVNDSGVPVQIGYPRRFDPAYAAARNAVGDGELGWVHTVRSTTLDPAPPPRGYIEVSGGIFRDCSVHDFDTVRWVTGREVVEVYATGSARGDDFFAELGDVATAQTLLTFDDGATAVVSNTRYNPRGHDVRLEVHGTDDSVAAGWSDNTPLRNLEPGSDWPAGKPWTFFMDRLADGLPRRAHRLHRGRCRTAAIARAPSTTRWPWRGWPRPPPFPCNSTARCRSTRSSDEHDTNHHLPAPALSRTAHGSPARPSPGGSARSRTGATSSPRSRVLAEMHDIGLAATELGPEGFLPADPDQMAEVLDAHQLTAVGGFTPVLMHQPGHDPLPEIDRILDRYARHSTPRCSCCPRRPGWTATTAARHWTTTVGTCCCATWTGSATGPPNTACRAVLHPHVGHHGRERRRGAAGARWLLDLAVPGHRAPADRRHRPGGTDPAGPGPHRPHPPQGRRQPDRRQGPRRPAHLHRRRGRRACTGRWAPATSTSQRS